MLKNKIRMRRMETIVTCLAVKRVAFIAIVLGISLCYGVHVNAQTRLRDLLIMKTTINVLPDNAIIYIWNAEVATGTYEYTIRTRIELKEVPAQEE